MSAENSPVETKNATLSTKKAAKVAGLRGDNEQLASKSLEENQDNTDVIEEIAHDSNKPEYKNGWQLWVVMCTIFLATLLAALDIVSKPISIKSSLTSLYYRVL